AVLGSQDDRRPRDRDLTLAVELLELRQGLVGICVVDEVHCDHAFHVSSFRLRFVRARAQTALAAGPAAASVLGVLALPVGSPQASSTAFGRSLTWNA